MEYEIVWNGSHKDVYLCIPEFQARDFSHVAPAKGACQPAKYRQHGPLREHLLALLGQRELWLTSELRKTCGLNKGQFWNVLNSLGRRGWLTRSPGVVALKRTDAE